ncbi:hypothetical protein GIB67_030392 [Kingdonia uniflora]|uniref:Uncharacterized protein n=1 Tax=Kingdonia uniflora TaxID=39325 RepID=A0A7J7NWQ0_9MAGN|nr:hypothetical protein GIB67_017729 [Kingdonia uniflora]KAF6171626.1 hypothetical protein GIB67_030392 [Kingdonia uniflora]
MSDSRFFNKQTCDLLWRYGMLQTGDFIYILKVNIIYLISLEVFILFNIVFNLLLLVMDHTFNFGMLCSNNLGPQSVLPTVSVI